MINEKISIYLIALGICLIIGLSAGQDWLVGGYVSSFGPYDDPAIFGLKRWLDYPYSTYYLYTAKGSYYSFPTPYGVYPYYPSYYYYSAGWTPLYGVGWQDYNAKWAKTLEYAQTKSSIRVYPIGAMTYPPSQPTTTISSSPTSMQMEAAPTTPATGATEKTTATTTYYSPEYMSTAPPSTPATTPETTPASSAVAAPIAPTTGDSTANIVSEGMRGYQVFLNGAYIGTEGTGGDVLDGRFSFKVMGNRNHSVRVYDGQFNYSKILFFEPESTKTIYVEPGKGFRI